LIDADNELDLKRTYSFLQVATINGMNMNMKLMVGFQMLVTVLITYTYEGIKLMRFFFASARKLQTFFRTYK